MTYSSYFSAPAIAIAAMVTVFSFPSDAVAQRGSSAKEAVNTMSTQLGPQAVQWIAEIQGINGIPQPTEWHVLAYDAQAQQLLRRFWFAEGRAGDNGPDLQRYPSNVPVGYFSINQVQVDSVAAFTIAEAEARKAKMGFDNCSYLLRVREYSSEPIWRLSLIDVNQRLVGKIYISGQNGEVLRTVWIDQSRGGKITDSSAPGNRRPQATSGTGLSTTGIVDPGQTGPGMSGGITGNYQGPDTPASSRAQKPAVAPTPPSSFSRTPPRMTTTTPPSGTRISPVPTPREPVATVRPKSTVTVKNTDRAIRDMRVAPSKPVAPKPIPKPAPAPTPKPKPVSKPPVSKPVKKPSGGRIPPPPIPGS